jgi:hypothetical protein
MTLSVTESVDLPIDVIIVKDRYRKPENRGELQELAEDIKELGQIVPIMVTRDMRLVHGERRLLALKLLGRTTVRAEIATVENDVDYLSIERSENVYRKPFTPGEEARLEATILARKREQRPRMTEREYEEYRDVPRTTIRRRLEVNDIWYKGKVGQTAQPEIALASCYEPFWLARKGTPRMLGEGRANVFDHEAVHPTKKIHSTEKPPELLDDILKTMLLPGRNILVPFLGSGATLRSAYRLGHHGHGFDLSENNKERFLKAVEEEFAESAEA